MIDQLEHKNSNIKEELVSTKEALNRALLDKEVLEQQKSEVSKYSYTLSREAHIDKMQNKKLH